MKLCPTCNSQYTDDTLQFCLQDGTPLAGGASVETPTVVLNETETVVAERGARQSSAGPEPASGAWPQSQVTRVAEAQPATGSNTAVIVAAVGVILMVIVLVAGIGLWVFLRKANGVVANTGSNSGYASPTTTSTPFGSSPTPSATPTASPASTPLVPANVFTAPPADTSQASTEVSGRVSAWRSALESRDFNGYMGNYADTVDYYNRRGVSVGTIRADKARAFSLYSSMRVSISNMSVDVAPDGKTATSTFDKEWVFDGRDRSEGKTRSQLEFRRINDRWLITAERDLKLYYKR